MTNSQTKDSKMDEEKKIAVCYCGNPLIYTFAFSGAEYYCLDCGNTFGMFDTDRKTATSELIKKLKADTRKFKTVNKHLLSGGAMIRDCEICSRESEPHIYHCSEEEKKNHQKAMAKLKKWSNEDEY